MFALLLGLGLAFAQPSGFEPPAPPEAPVALEAPAAPEAPEPPSPLEAPEPPGLPVPPTPPVAPRFEADGELSITGVINDVFGMGGSVLVSDPVGDNAFLMGGEIHVDQPVLGDLFATGGRIEIDAPVHGDVYVSGGEVTLGPKGAVLGHMIAFGGEVELEGPVAGSVNVGGGRVRLYGPIAGDVRLEAGEVTVGTKGQVAGDLTYSSAKPVPGLAEIVSGEVNWTERVAEVAAEPEPSSFLGDLVGSAVGWIAWKFWAYSSKLLVGGLLLLVGGSLAGGVGRLLLERPSESVGVGIAVSVVLPLVSTLAICLILPFPLGLMGYAAYAVGLYVSQLIVAQAIGDLVLRSFKPGTYGSPFLSLAVGLAPLLLLISIPWLGYLVWYLATILGFGAMWLRIRELAAA